MNERYAPDCDDIAARCAKGTDNGIETGNTLLPIIWTYIYIYMIGIIRIIRVYTYVYSVLEA